LIALRTISSQSGADQWEALRPVLIEYGIETKIGVLVKQFYLIDQALVIQCLLMELPLPLYQDRLMNR
jgi:hypothetical protein